MIIGYLDCNNKNISIDEQQATIDQYVLNTYNSIDIYFSESNINNITNTAPNNIIITANILSLGNSLNIIKNNLKNLLNQNCKIISVKENLIFEPSQEIEWLIKGIELSIDIRNSMVSTITKKALDCKRSNGCKLGREFGSKNKKKIWEGKEEEIKQMLLSGYSRKQTAEEVGISTVSLYNYIKQNSELKNMLNGDINA